MAIVFLFLFSPCPQSRQLTQLPNTDHYKDTFSWESKTPLSNQKCWICIYWFAFFTSKHTNLSNSRRVEEMRVEVHCTVSGPLPFSKTCVIVSWTKLIIWNVDKILSFGSWTLPLPVSLVLAKKTKKEMAVPPWKYRMKKYMVQDCNNFYFFYFIVS